MHSTHVLIRGHIFTYAEKAPFAVSGESVLGALEYDCETDKTKCHECGEWSSGLGGHIKMHGLKRVDYNQRHGLRIHTAISGPKRSRQCACNEFDKIARGGGITAPEMKRRRIARGSNKGTRQRPKSVELLNENNRCRAQLIFRLQTLAAEVQHTPTGPERYRAMIQNSTLVDRFGSVEKAMLAAGLEPNSRDEGPGPKDLPHGFPTKEEIAARKAKWEAPMPWPKDYGRVTAMPRSSTPLSDSW